MAWRRSKREPATGAQAVDLEAIFDYEAFLEHVPDVVGRLSALRD
jgi:hypothetical protein